MKLAPYISFLLVAAALTGCGDKPQTGDGHGRSAEKAEGKDGGHGHEAETPSGASFKAGKGVMLTDETKKILGVEVTEVTEQKLPAQIRFNVQVFGEKHHHAIRDDDHTGCDVHGSGFLPSDKAEAVRPGQKVEVQTRTNESLAGVVLAVEKALSFGEVEVIVGLTNATDKVKPGEFLSAVINLPRDIVVRVIPRLALLRTSEGTFVYTLNGEAYLRTPVKLGSEANGLLEITDGLLAGDSVVTKPVETFYLIELRATKGGGHSH
ncbi:MAG: efflux RND transporter periplasmic adaptor subunit [Verrucomicrobiota bacterium]